MEHKSISFNFENTHDVSQYRSYPKEKFVKLLGTPYYNTAKCNKLLTKDTESIKCFTNHRLFPYEKYKDNIVDCELEYALDKRLENPSLAKSVYKNSVILDPLKKKILDEYYDGVEIFQSYRFEDKAINDLHHNKLDWSNWKEIYLKNNFWSFLGDDPLPKAYVAKNQLFQCSNSLNSQPEISDRQFQSTIQDNNIKKLKVHIEPEIYTNYIVSLFHNDINRVNVKENSKIPFSQLKEYGEKFLIDCRTDSLVSDFRKWLILEKPQQFNETLPCSAKQFLLSFENKNELKLDWNKIYKDLSTDKLEELRSERNKITKRYTISQPKKQSIAQSEIYKVAGDRYILRKLG